MQVDGDVGSPEVQLSVLSQLLLPSFSPLDRPQYLALLSGYTIPQLRYLK